MQLETHVDGFDLNQGDIIGLDENAILAKGEQINETTIELIEKIKTENVVNITMFYGKEVKENDAEKLKSTLEKKYPECDIILINGGQPVYYYILSLE